MTSYEVSISPLFRSQSSTVIPFVSAFSVNRLAIAFAEEKLLQRNSCYADVWLFSLARILGNVPSGCRSTSGPDARR